MSSISVTNKDRDKLIGSPDMAYVSSLIWR